METLHIRLNILIAYLQLLMLNISSSKTLEWYVLAHFLKNWCYMLQTTYHYIPAKAELVTTESHTCATVEGMPLHSMRILISPTSDPSKIWHHCQTSPCFCRENILKSVTQAFSQLYLMSFTDNFPFKNWKVNCSFFKVHTLEGPCMSHFQPCPLCPISFTRP